jgi:hypothetical protein
MVFCIAGYIYNFIDLLVQNKEINRLLNANRDVKKSKTGIMLDCFRYRARPYEYFSFHFDKLKRCEKKAFVTDNFNGVLSYIFSDRNAAYSLFMNKLNTYQELESFYQRTILLVEKAISSDILDFVIANSIFILKPLDLTKGVGIELMYVDEYGSPINCRNHLLENYGGGRYIVEEIVVNEEHIRKFHPNSLNTVRIPTFLLKNGDVMIDFIFIRFGRDSSVVDNAGQGGIFCAVNAETGIIESDGVDEHGGRYETHPNSGLKFKGFVIPNWEDARGLAIQLAKTINPNIRYVGWDLALSERGWLLIEGNRSGQFVGQIATQVGIKPRIFQILQAME